MSGYFVNETYPNAPNVIRTADPLLIRLSDLALQVGDTVYKAIIKFGIKYCGFYIYQNCTGYPVYMYLDEELTANWARAGNSSATMATTEGAIVEALKEEAKQWIDNLEEAIANKKSDNEIKKALDRLCWQVHYDITKSQTDFIDEFPDFSNVSIDTQGATIYDMSQDITGGSSGEPASLHSISVDLSGIGTTVGGKLDTLNNNLSTFDSNLTGSSGAIKTYVGDNLYRDASGVIVENTVAGMLNKVATNLRADDDGVTQREYTISKALRDVSDNPNYSVSYATYQQTQLELEHFQTISQTQLGDFGSNGARSLYQTLGVYTDPQKNTLSDAVGVTSDTSSNNTLLGRTATSNSTIGSLVEGISGTVGGINTDVGTIKTDVGTIKTDVGTTKTDVGLIKTDVGLTKTDVGTIKTDVGLIKTQIRCTRGDIGSLVNDMYNGMWGNGQGISGFIDNDGSTYYVKSDQI